MAASMTKSVRKQRKGLWCERALRIMTSHRLSQLINVHHKYFNHISAASSMYMYCKRFYSFYIHKSLS